MRSAARQIAENAEQRARSSSASCWTSEPNHGFDAQSGTYVDMLKAGIIDRYPPEAVAGRQLIQVLEIRRSAALWAAGRSAST